MSKEYRKNIFRQDVIDSIEWVEMRPLTKSAEETKRLCVNRIPLPIPRHRPHGGRPPLHYPSGIHIKFKNNGRVFHVQYQPSNGMARVRSMTSGMRFYPREFALLQRMAAERVTG